MCSLMETTSRLDSVKTPALHLRRLYSAVQSWNQAAAGIIFATLTSPLMGKRLALYRKEKVMKKIIGCIGLIGAGFVIGMVYTICDLTWAATDDPESFDRLIATMKA